MLCFTWQTSIITRHDASPVLDGYSARRIMMDKNIYIELCKKNPHLVFRESQFLMAERIYYTLTSPKTITPIEASTGYGKTLVFLLAAITFAKKTGEKVAIVTPQKNLQDQILKETMLFSGTSFSGVRVAVVKGKSNYISKAKIDALIGERKGKGTLEDAVIEFAAEVERVGGDFERISDAAIPDYIKKHGSIEYLLSSSDTESSMETEYYARALTNARNASVVVVNSAFFFAWSSRGGNDNIPFSLSKIIIDEAHTLPQNAMLFLSAKVSIDGLRSRFSRMIDIFDSEKIRNKATDTARTIYADLIALNVRLMDQRRGENNVLSLDHMRYSSRVAFNSIRESLLAISKDIAGYVKAAAGTVAKHDELLGPYFTEIAQAGKNLNSVVGSLGNKNNSTVTLLQFSEHRHVPSVVCVSPNVAPFLVSILKKYDSIVMCSGTLTSESGSFGALKNMMGLNSLRNMMTLQDAVIMPRPFKWGIKFLYYPSAPVFSPSDKNGVYKKEYYTEMLPFFEFIISKARRSVLVLVPANEDVAIVSGILNSYGTDGRTVLACMPDGLSKQEAKFAVENNPKGVVVISASLGVGFNPEGNSLSDLIIPRIPNPHKNDPYWCARMERLGDQRNTAYGEMHFACFSQLRQWMGRLARKEGDKGNIHFLDSRCSQPDKKYSGYLEFFKKEFGGLTEVAIKQEDVKSIQNR